MGAKGMRTSVYESVIYVKAILLIGVKPKLQIAYPTATMGQPIPFSNLTPNISAPAGTKGTNGAIIQSRISDS